MYPTCNQRCHQVKKCEVEPRPKDLVSYFVTGAFRIFQKAKDIHACSETGRNVAAARTIFDVSKLKNTDE